MSGVNYKIIDATVDETGMTTLRVEFSNGIPGWTLLVDFNKSPSDSMESVIERVMNKKGDIEEGRRVSPLLDAVKGLEFTAEETAEQVLMRIQTAIDSVATPQE